MFFFFLTERKHLQNFQKCFLSYKERCFCPGDIQILVFPSSPPFAIAEYTGEAN